ncbi:MAG: T9SS type A sorting domain-containing protein [Flavobacteriales bacterium]
MKLRRTIAILAFSLSSVFCQAQDWEMVSEEFSQAVNQLFHDPGSDLFFIGGAFGYLGDEHVGGIVSYDGEEYYTYGCGYDCSEPFTDIVSGAFSAMCSLRDTLYLKGISTTSIFSIDSMFNNTPNTLVVMRFVNDEFSSMDISFENNELSSNIMSTYSIDEDLYVFATHSGTVAGFEGFGGAKYSGFEWTPYEVPGCEELSGVGGLINYEDHLYICGSFVSCPGEQPVNDIMRWNGEEWSDLGTGLGVFGLNNVNDMVIMNSELYVSGRFEEVGGIPAHNLAKWDGNQWCAIEHDFTNTYIRTIGVYQNELYVYASTEEFSSRLWKWTGTAETCSEEFNSISEQREPESLTLYPNPASDLLTITLPKQFDGSGTISITDGLGRTVEEFTEEIQAGSQITIATLNLPIGLYTLKFRHEEGVYAARFVKE